MELFIKDPSFLVMQNGQNMFDAGRVRVVVLLKTESSGIFHNPSFGSKEIELSIKAKNENAQSLRPVDESNLKELTEFNKYTCLIRLASISRDNRMYTLIMQPITDRFDMIEGRYEVDMKRRNYSIWLRRDERWPNGLVFKLIKTNYPNIDYIVGEFLFFFSSGQF